MTHTVSVPDFDGADRSASMVTWFIRQGAPVEQGAPLCEIEVDKVTVEIESPAAGVLHRVLVAEGEATSAGSPLAIIAGADEEIPQEAPAAPARQGMNEHASAVPSLVEEEGADIRSGPAEPLNAMRRVVARRMVQSKLSAPHFCLTTIVDMSEAQALRKRLKKDRVRATFNDMIIKASALALRKYPRVASLYSPEGYIPRDRMNVGFAVEAEPDGLVVPVIHEADKMTLADISVATKLLIDKARNKKMVPADYAEGIFTVSNLSSFDVDMFTAIINPGEAAILAVGKITDTPVAVRGEVLIRPLMKITLCSDHRVVDGALAARFNGTLKGLLQDPDQLV